MIKSIIKRVATIALAGAMIIGSLSVNNLQVEAADIHTEDSMENPIVLQDGHGDGMELSANNTVDYFKFTVDKKSTIVFNFGSIMSQFNTAKYNYSIKDSNLNEIKSGTVASADISKVEMILTPGDYYIIVNATSYGDYMISWYSGTPVTQAISFYTTNGDTVELGKPISLIVVSNTEGSVDKDCKWTVSNRKMFSASTENSQDICGHANYCGTITFTATLISDESVKASKTFTIVPPKTKISKAVNSKSKQMKITCKKVKSVKGCQSVKGYQVQYSKDKNFTKATTNKIKKGNTITLNKLKKKTYYVRVRTYAKGIDGKTYYSAWSGAKKVKIKK